MSSLSIAVWVLLWFGLVCLGGPAAALGRTESRRTLVQDLGPALVWNWLAIAWLVPLASSVKAFNWVTALVIGAVAPTVWWLAHNASHPAPVRDLVRSIIFHAVSGSDERPAIRPIRDGAVMVLAMPLVLLPYVMTGVEIRLPVPADFDTLARTEQLMAMARGFVWDPLAALSAVVTRVSAVDAVRVVGAMRLALVALTAGGTGYIVARVLGWPLGVLAAVAVVALVPWLPLAFWAAALITTIGVSSLGVWVKHRRLRDGWHAAAAFSLAAGVVLPYWPDPGVLVRPQQTPRFLEYPSAVEQALRLTGRQVGDDWVLVGVPELQLEIGRKGRSYDLARFVSRFHGRSGDPRFRFDVGGDRLYVFVEKQALDVEPTVHDGRFVTGQLAAYRVRRERIRLHRLARQICEDYRRTHAGVVVRHDDEVLRVYEIVL